MPPADQSTSPRWAPPPSRCWGEPGVQWRKVGGPGWRWAPAASLHCCVAWSTPCPSALHWSYPDKNGVCQKRCLTLLTEHWRVTDAIKLCHETKISLVLLWLLAVWYNLEQATVLQLYKYISIQYRLLWGSFSDEILTLLSSSFISRDMSNINTWSTCCRLWKASSLCLFFGTRRKAAANVIRTRATWWHMRSGCGGLNMLKECKMASLHRWVKPNTM